MKCRKLDTLRIGRSGMLECNHEEEEFFYNGDDEFARCIKCKSVRRVIWQGHVKEA